MCLIMMLCGCTGYHLGQFKQQVSLGRHWLLVKFYYSSGVFIVQGEKRQIYDENIRVPLIVRGPGVKPSNTSSIALNIDLVSPCYSASFADLIAPLPRKLK